MLTFYYKNIQSKCLIRVRKNFSCINNSVIQLSWTTLKVRFLHSAFKWPFQEAIQFDYPTIVAQEIIERNNLHKDMIFWTVWFCHFIYPEYKTVLLFLFVWNNFCGQKMGWKKIDWHSAVHKFEGISVSSSLQYAHVVMGNQHHRNYNARLNSLKCKDLNKCFGTCALNAFQTIKKSNHEKNWKTSSSCSLSSKPDRELESEQCYY